jgi:hypothetical protein
MQRAITILKIIVNSYISSSSAIASYLDQSSNQMVRQIEIIILGFAYSESHDWNVLWMNTSGKPYLYEGLNEF